MRSAEWSDPELDGLLRAAARDRRCVFVAGLPGAGKSLLVQQTARLAGEIGRTVHLLQWDVARLAFDTPAILARYPEIGGVTHGAIRLAVGCWARGAVLRWHRALPGPRHILIGETPLVGERLMELARPRADDLEPLLAGEATAFLVPVPSRAVRRTIEDARAREIADPRHRRDAASAPPHLVRWHWDEIERVAAALGTARPRTEGGYDPELYAATYQRLLRHRRVIVVPMARVLRMHASAHEPPIGASEIVPSVEEVAEAISRVERSPSSEIERRTAEWYRA